MKASPFLVAASFMLGAIVILLASIALRSNTVQAQPSGDGNLKGVTAITVNGGSGKEYLVVLKEVENSMMLGGSGAEFKTVTAMAVYDFAAGGAGKVSLLASRYLEWDLRMYDWMPGGGKIMGVADVKKQYEDLKKQAKDRDDKENNKTK